MSTAPTVEVRCGAKGCNRLLASLDKPPPAGSSFWSDSHRVAWVEPCRKHGGVPGTIEQLRARRAAAGESEVDRGHLFHRIPWSALRKAFEESATRQRSVVYLVRPLRR